MHIKASRLLRSAAVVVVSCLPAVASAQQYGTLVETYTATETLQVTMPGMVSQGGNAIMFTSELRFDTLTFTPGPVAYNNTQIDFSGSEACIQQARAVCKVALQNQPGATVTGNGVATLPTGGGGQVVGSVRWEDVALGSGFANGNFALTVGDDFRSYTWDLPWMVPCVQGLVGSLVAIDAEHHITSVDAATGLVTMTATGQVFAHPQ